MVEQAATDQTAMQHLGELRMRLGACVAVLLVGSGFGYIVRDPIIAALQRPLGEKLFYTSPMGGFDFIMRVCLLVGFLVALPVFSYNLLRFVEPVLPKALGWPRMIAIISCSSILAVAGVAVAYYLSLPTVLHFFATIGAGSIHPLISVDRYLSFVLGYFATFALVFQLPLVLLFINNVTPLGPTGLSKWRKWVAVAAFVLALVLAPDPLSQIILALPIIVLYEASIWLIRLVNRRKLVHAAVVPAVLPPSTSRRKLAPARPAAVVDLHDRPTRFHPRPLVNVLDLRSP